MKKFFVWAIISIFSIVFLATSFSVEAQSLPAEVTNETEKDRLKQYSEYEGIYTDFSSGIFEHNQKNQIEFEIISDSKLEYAIEFNSEMGEILGDKSRISIEQEFTLEFKESQSGEDVIHIVALSSENSYQIDIFVYSSEKYDYVNIYSSETSRKMFYVNEVSDNTFSYEFCRFVYGDSFSVQTKSSIENEKIDSERNDQTKRSLPPSTTLNVFGEVKYQNENLSTYSFAESVRVRIYDKNGNQSVLLAETFTDANGSYSVTFENDLLENGYDICVVIILYLDEVAVVDGLVSSYSLTSPIAYDQIASTEIDFSSNLSSEIGQAFHVYHDGVLGIAYLNHLDPTRDKSGHLVNIVYPYLFGSWYDPVFDLIHIKGNTYSDQDATLHEFGHYIADRYGLTSFIAKPNHSFYTNQSDVYGKIAGTKLAWSEGWASFFSAMAGAKTTYGGLSLETPNPSCIFGDAGEYSIVNFLYDMQDPANDDPIGWQGGDEDLFNFLQIGDINITLSDVIQDYISEGYSIEEIGPILSTLKISSKLLSPSNNASISTFYSPLFTWNAQGGSTDYPNNLFEISIYRQNGSPIISRITTGTSYTFSSADWTTILNSGCSSVKWNVSAYQTSNPQTGPYPSEFRTLTLPPVTSIFSGGTYTSILSMGSCFWYKFYVSETANYTFYTTGTTDTYGEFFFSIVPGQEVTGCFSWDNNSGSGTNFSKKLLLYQGETIYIRVRGNYWTAVGSFSLHVSFPSQC